MSNTKKELTAEEQAIATQQAETKQILDAQAAAADQTSHIEKLEAENAEYLRKTQSDTSIIEDLNGKLSQKDIEIKRLSDALAEAEDLITEQQTALSEPVDESEKVHVTHDKKKYHVAVPRFKLGGVEYAAADLKSKPDLVKQLVERRSSVLRAVK